MLLLFSLGVILSIIGTFKLASKMRYKHFLKVKAEEVSLTCGSYERAEVNVFIKYFFPKGFYKYKVDGNEYTSSLIFSDKKYIQFTDEVSANNLLKNIIECNIVYYNPDVPQHAVLYVPPSTQILNKDGSLFIVGVSLILLSLVLHFM